jgi:hypothetical protein
MMGIIPKKPLFRGDKRGYEAKNPTRGRPPKPGEAAAHGLDR